MLLDYGLNEIKPYVVRIVIEKTRTLPNSGKWIVIEFDEINKYRDLYDNVQDQIEDYFFCVNASRNEKIQANQLMCLPMVTCLGCILVIL